LPELRKDPVIGRWVIISPERGQRPTNFPNPPRSVDPKYCPFCPGQEEQTPIEVYCHRPATTSPNRPGWQVRVVSNKYPALRIEGELLRASHGLYERMQGIGAHEVIIETPNHTADMADFSESEIYEVFRAYQHRYEDLARDRRFKYILIFKNDGEAAGATLEHAHSQLIATPIVPSRIADELTGASRYFDLKERCIFCDMIRQEIADGSRVVTEHTDFVTFCPYAGAFPFETWIAPREHRAHFGDTNEAALRGLAGALRDALQRLREALNNPAYNFIIHSAPLGERYSEYYHWHIEIIPKLTKTAGFEWGSGFHINPTPPEDAAAYMRRLEVRAVSATA